MILGNDARVGSLMGTVRSQGTTATLLRRRRGSLTAIQVLRARVQCERTRALTGPQMLRITIIKVQ